jgi:hypothetical protein
MIWKNWKQFDKDIVNITNKSFFLNCVFLSLVQQEQQQQLPTSVCEIFDMYTNNGEGRLTFLCQIRPIRERRSKAIKFAMISQLIE